MPDPEPIPFYPSLACHAAPLRPGSAPLLGCECRICEWARNKATGESYLAGVSGPIQPGTPAWEALLAEATR